MQWRFVGGTAERGGGAVSTASGWAVLDRMRYEKSRLSNTASRKDRAFVRYGHDRLLQFGKL